MSVSDQLKRTIQTCGRTQAELARESGVAESVISRFIRGETTIGQDNMDKLCRYLGLRLTPVKTGRTTKGR